MFCDDGIGDVENQDKVPLYLKQVTVLRRPPPITGLEANRLQCLQ